MFQVVNIFADCETYVSLPLNFKSITPKTEEILKTIREVGVVYPWLICYKLEGEDKVRHSLYDDHQHRGFFQFLASLANTGTRVVLWFHNTTYDTTAIFETCGITEYEVRVKDCSGHQFIGGWFKVPGCKWKIRLADTTLYERISLRKVGELVGYPKGEIPYNMANMSINAKKRRLEYINLTNYRKESYPLRDAVDYCKRDVELLEILHGMQTKFKKEISRTVLGYEADRSVANLTQGTHSKSLLNLFMNGIDFEHDFRCVVTPEEYVKMQSVGGFTSINK